MNGEYSKEILKLTGIIKEQEEELLELRRKRDSSGSYLEDFFSMVDKAECCLDMDYCNMYKGVNLKIESNFHAGASFERYRICQSEFKDAILEATEFLKDRMEYSVEVDSVDFLSDEDKERRIFPQIKIKKKVSNAVDH